MLLQPATTHRHGIFGKIPVEPLQREYQSTRLQHVKHAKRRSSIELSSRCDFTGHMTQRARYRVLLGVELSMG